MTYHLIDNNYHLVLCAAGAKHALLTATAGGKPWPQLMRHPDIGAASGQRQAHLSPATDSLAEIGGVIHPLRLLEAAEIPRRWADTGKLLPDVAHYWEGRALLRIFVRVHTPGHRCWHRSDGLQHMCCTRSPCAGPLRQLSNARSALARRHPSALGDAPRSVEAALTQLYPAAAFLCHRYVKRDQKNVSDVRATPRSTSAGTSRRPNLQGTRRFTSC